MAALKQLEQENKIIEKIGFHPMLNLIRACQSLDVQNVNVPEAQEVYITTQNPITNPLQILVGKKMNMWSMISGILPGFLKI